MLVIEPFAFNSSPVATTSTFPDFNSSIALVNFPFISSFKFGFSFNTLVSAEFFTLMQR